MVWPRSRINASGRTAQAPSHSSFNAYSCASRSRLTAEGCSAESLTIKTLPSLPSAFSRGSRQKIRSPSSHKTSRRSSLLGPREDTFPAGLQSLAGRLHETGAEVLVGLVGQRILKNTLQW